MLGRRILKIAVKSDIPIWNYHHPTFTRSTLAGQLIPQLRRSFSSKSASSVENNDDPPKFQLRRPDGTRLCGMDIFEEVKKVVGKKDDEDFTIPKNAFEAILSEYDILVEEAHQWKDKYQRALAETENVRTRGIKLAEEAKMFAIQEFSKDLLEVADILDLAVDSVTPEQLENGGKTLVDLHEGVVMTKTVLLKVFERHGLIAVNPTGKKFDPKLHEAVFQVPVDKGENSEPGLITHVAKIGYSLNDRPIRPAQVGVVSDG